MKRKSIWMIAAMIGMLATGCGQSTAQESETQTEAVQEDAAEQDEAEASDKTEQDEAGQAEDEAQQGAAQEDAAQETENTQPEDTQAGQPAEETAGQAEEGQPSSGTYEDNFAVDSAAAAAFGSSIKEAVAEKDLEKLADLAAYPLYVGFAEGGEDVGSSEDLIALGADKIFTEELMASVAAADENALSPSRAGFVLSNGGTANIVFGVRDGVLAISGINY